MSTTTTTKDILTLHRAVIVLSLRRDDANMASVHAMEAAKSMLPDDLAASLAHISDVALSRIRFGTVRSNTKDVYADFDGRLEVAVDHGPAGHDMHAEL